MRILRKWLSGIVNRFVKKVPINLLMLIEDKVQFAMGKGFGAATTDEEAKVIAQFIEDRQIQKVVALDVGANVGNWSASILSALPAARIIAFEPSKQAFSKLLLRFRDFPNVSCVNTALGKSDEKSILYADESASGLSSLTKRRVAHFGIDFSYSEEVEIAKLDTWIKSQVKDFSPNILKMDVEGHEFDVLRGADETLSSIEIVQFEFGGSNIDTRTFFQDFWYFFIDRGFDIYRISPTGPILIEKYRESDETFRPTNYVAVKK
jgi:FkbM family methyltransferase